MNGVPDPPDAQSRRQYIRERRQQLEEELQRIQQQKAALELQLQALNGDVGIGAGPAKTARGPNKTGALAHFGAAGVSDRAQIEAEREKTVTALFQQCQTILRNVKTNQKALMFIEPVDPVKLKILDYFQFVKKPMALNDVVGKLSHNPPKGVFRKYKNVYEFRDDMRQIWENCRIYNPVGQPVRTNGDLMSEYWEKKWATSGLEQKWEEEMLRQRQEEMRLAGGPELPHQMEEMDRELRMLQQQPQVEAQDGEVAAPGNRPMTFEEKRRLSQGLGTLSGDKLGLVMEIIAESQRIDQDAEVEVNIDDLSQATLWSLNSLVTDICIGRLPEPGTAKAREGPADAGGRNDEGGAGPRESQEDKQQGSAEMLIERSRENASGHEDSEAEPSDSQGEVGSKQLAGSTANHGTKVQQSHAGDAMDFVSATVPRQQPQIIKNHANKKEVTLQNANAWATLTEKPDDEGGGGDGDGDGEGGEGEEGNDGDDNLWDQFKTLEEHQQQQEEDKKAEEERKRKEREAADEAAARDAEERRKAAEAEKEAARAAEQEKADEARRAIEEQRAREVAQLQSMDKPSDLRDQQELFVDGGNNALGDVFGLQLKGGDDDDEDFGEDEDDDAEDGEV